jgi:hypothetical protein
LTTSQAAAVMGVTKIRVSQLARAGRLPHEVSRHGWRLFRPEQVAVIGNARRSGSTPTRPTWVEPAHGLAQLVDVLCGYRRKGTSGD